MFNYEEITKKKKTIKIKLKNIFFMQKLKCNENIVLISKTIIMYSITIYVSYFYRIDNKIVQKIPDQ